MSEYCTTIDIAADYKINTRISITRDVAQFFLVFVATIITGATANFYNIPIISFASTGAEFSDKQIYPTMARTVPSVAQ